MPFLESPYSDALLCDARFLLPLLRINYSINKSDCSTNRRQRPLVIVPDLSDAAKCDIGLALPISVGIITKRARIIGSATRRDHRLGTLSARPLPSTTYHHLRALGNHQIHSTTIHYSTIFRPPELGITSDTALQLLNCSRRPSR